MCIEARSHMSCVSPTNGLGLRRKNRSYSCSYSSGCGRFKGLSDRFKGCRRCQISRGRHAIQRRCLPFRYSDRCAIVRGELRPVLIRDPALIRES